MSAHSVMTLAQKALEPFSQCYCCAVLNHEGRPLLWFRSDNITPCSEALSSQKAYTAFAFQMDTDVIAQKLGDTGISAVSGNGYCFLPGGAVAQGQEQNLYYVGVSTENPDIDSEAAHAVVRCLLEKK